MSSNEVDAECSTVALMPEHLVATPEGRVLIRHPLLDKHVTDFTAVAQNRWETLKKWQPKKDAIVINAFDKSGTHWLFDIMMMLMKGDAAQNPHHKCAAMFEMVSPADMPEPCVYNTHLLPSQLPPRIQELKTVHVIRNPKDVFVSAFYHVWAMEGLFKMKCVEDGYTFDQHFTEHTHQSAVGATTSWFSFVKEVWMRRNDSNRLIIFYEDLFKNFTLTVRKVADFWGLSPSDELIKQIHESTTLEKIKACKPVVCKPEDECYKGLYRKGGVGGWKSYFTVAQNERFDEIYKETMIGCDELVLQYE